MSHIDVSTRKEYLRKYCKSLITRNKDEDAKRDRRILSMVCELLLKLARKSVGIYWPLAREVDLTTLIRELPELTFALPKIKEQTMIFTLYSAGNHLISNVYNIYETASDEEVFPEVLLVPGLAFCFLGNRLGSGKGYYDRYIVDRLSNNPDLVTIGICRQYQLMRQIPATTHDQRMEYVVSDLLLLHIPQPKHEYV